MLKFIMESIFLIESLKSAKEFATKTNISADIFDKLNELDITPTKKLIHQILKWYVGDSSMIDKLDDVTNKLKTFIKFSGGRIKEPIEKFKTFEEFTTFITPFLDIETKADKKDALAGQYKKVFENENMLVVIPFTHKASCIYGAKTKWCTTARAASYFNDYQADGDSIYYVINKKDTNQNNRLHKMAVVVTSDGRIPRCFDTFDENSPVLIKTWIKNNGIPMLSTIFKPMVDDEGFINNQLQKYKKLKNLKLDSSEYKMYKTISKDKLDSVFPNLTKIDIGNGYGNALPITKMPDVPSTVTTVLISNAKIFDLESINREDMNVIIYIGEISGEAPRQFINCDKLSMTIKFNGYLQRIWKLLPKIKIMILTSNFKDLKFNTNRVYGTMYKYRGAATDITTKTDFNNKIKEIFAERDGTLPVNKKK